MAFGQEILLRFVLSIDYVNIYIFLKCSVNFQIISVLLDAFTPISSSERSMSLSAANGLGSAVSFRITGLSPPTDSRTSRLSALDGDGQLDGKTGGPAFTLAQRENLSASDFNGCSQLRAESKSPSNSRLDRLDELKVVEGSALQALRMEYLHQVCRCLLLLVRHRSVNIEVLGVALLIHRFQLISIHLKLFSRIFWS